MGGKNKNKRKAQNLEQQANTESSVAEKTQPEAPPKPVEKESLSTEESKTSSESVQETTKPREEEKTVPEPQKTKAEESKLEKPEETKEQAITQEPKSQEPKPQEPKPQETKPQEPKPQEPKPQEPKPQESKPQEPKPQEPKPQEPKPQEPKPQEPKPQEPKPQEPKFEEKKEQTPTQEKKLEGKTSPKQQRLEEKAEAPKPIENTYQINFSIKYDTSFGDKIKITGNKEQLGNWDPEKAIELEWNPENLWKTSLSIQKENLKDLEFKYVCQKANGELVWESGDNRDLSDEATQVGGSNLVCDRHDAWQVC